MSNRGYAKYTPFDTVHNAILHTFVDISVRYMIRSLHFDGVIQMVVFKGHWESFPCVMSIQESKWSPVEAGGGRWAASDGIESVGSYIRKDLAQNECNRRNHTVEGTYVTLDKRTRKWMANIPGHGYYGRYTDKADAIEAIRLRRNLAAERRLNNPPEPLRTIPQKMSLGGQYRVMVGKRYYGTYATPGHAVLVRDFVHGALGKPKWFPDYTMPEGLISNGTARSLIDGQVAYATAEERAEYDRRVDEINREIGARVINPSVAPPDEDTSDIQRVVDMDWRNV